MKKQKVNLRDLGTANHEGHSHGHDHDHGESPNGLKAYIPAAISLVMLLTGIGLDYFGISFFQGWIRLIW